MHKTNSRAVGVRGSALLGMLAKEVEKLLALYIGGILDGESAAL